MLKRLVCFCLLLLFLVPTAYSQQNSISIDPVNFDYETKTGTISGNINGDSTDTVNIKITDPSGTIVFLHSIAPGAQGGFGIGFGLKPDAAQGIYRVYAGGVSGRTAAESFFEVTQGVSVTKIEILPGERLSLAANESTQLQVILYYSDGSSVQAQNVVFVSANSDIASVSSNGEVRGVNTGETTITASTGGFEKKVQVKVSNISILGMDDDITITVGAVQGGNYNFVILNGTAADIAASELQSFIAAHPSAIVYIRSEKAGEQGLSFSFRMNSNLSGNTYVAFLGGVRNTPATKVKFRFYTKAERQNVILALKNTTTGSAVQNILTQNNLMFGIDFGGSFAQLGAQYQIELFDQMKGKTYNSAKEVSDDFYRLLEEMKYKQGVSEALKSVNAASAETIETVLQSTSSYLGLRLTGSYLHISDTGKAAVLSSVLHQNFSDAVMLKQKFHSALALVSVNEAERSNIESAISEHNDVILVNLSIKSSIKNAVLAAIININSTDISEIKKKYDELAAYYESQNVTSTGGGGGGGAKSSTSSAYFSPVPQQEQNAALYRDVDESHWAYGSIKALSEKKIVVGKTDGIFAPDDTVTREEFVKMLVLALNIQPGKEQMAFGDVSSEAWYYQSIQTAVSQKIVTGFSEKIFGVGANITREDMAVIVYRAVNSAGILLPDGQSEASFPDAAQISDYARQAVSALSESRIINGMDGNFVPQGNATRAQAAQIISKIMQ